MNKIKKILLSAVLAVTAAALLCACGTVTTEEASSYLDEEGTDIASGGSGTCTVSIDCSTILDNMNSLDSAKTSLVPDDGVILAQVEVAFDEGESVLDVLKKVTRENKIQMEFEDSPAYDGGYVNGIGNLYEFDCGDLSGWKYFVNDWEPNYSCANYIVSDGDVIEWLYTCELGKDLKQE